MKNQKCAIQKNYRSILTLLVVLFLMLSTTSYSQDQQPVYTVTSFMKVKQGNGGKYEQMEKEYWKPVHQELVKQGKILGWYLYQIQYTGTGDEYNYATVIHYEGSENFTTSYQDVTSKVHPNQKAEDIFKETMESRDLVTSRMLQWHLQSFPEGQRDPSKYAVVNYMKVPQGKIGEYGNLRRDYVKPAFDELVKQGKVEGWGMWRLAFPSGADMPYDMVSADFYNEIDQIGNNGLYQVIQKQNSDKDVDEIFKKMDETRTMAKRELWQLIDYAR